VVLAYLVHARPAALTMRDWQAVLRRGLREPLLHFLIAGAALYLLYALSGAGERDRDSRHIVVDRAALLRHMQYQARAFEPAVFAASLDAMGTAERQQLIDAYVREEVLYREAQALDLMQGDYVLRQRLVQRMAYLLEEEPAEQPGDAQLQEFLQANAQLYRVAASWTFTHVFLDPALHGDSAGAERAARSLLPTLQSRRAAFNDAPRYGDRFPFMQNYVERTTEFIASHFGEHFAASLAGLPADNAWHGPLQSAQGWHLVLSTAHATERLPELKEIRARVLEDWRRERATALQEQALRLLVDSYVVELRGLKPAP
jgi:hypothetical protein